MISLMDKMNNLYAIYKFNDHDIYIMEYFYADPVAMEFIRNNISYLVAAKVEKNNYTSAEMIIMDKYRKIISYDIEQFNTDHLNYNQVNGIVKYINRNSKQQSILHSKLFVEFLTDMFPVIPDDDNFHVDEIMMGISLCALFEKMPLKQVIEELINDFGKEAITDMINVKIDNLDEYIYKLIYFRSKISYKNN